MFRAIPLFEKNKDSFLTKFIDTIRATFKFPCRQRYVFVLLPLLQFFIYCNYYADEIEAVKVVLFFTGVF